MQDLYVGSCKFQEGTLSMGITLLKQCGYKEDNTYTFFIRNWFVRNWFIIAN